MKLSYLISRGFFCLDYFNILAHCEGYSLQGRAKIFIWKINRKTLKQTMRGLPKLHFFGDFDSLLVMDWLSNIVFLGFVNPTEKWVESKFNKQIFPFFFNFGPKFWTKKPNSVITNPSLSTYCFHKGFF